jgi:hypothetical protein
MARVAVVLTEVDRSDFEKKKKKNQIQELQEGSRFEVDGRRRLKPGHLQ